ncbi:MAG TPA: hypothetical protein VEV62_09725 [Parafilimonas sp.]|nr:hypothetical protein [Parafilimonas sp.]
MKAKFKTLLLCSVFLFAFIPTKHRLPGKWTVYNADGTSIGEYVELKNDGTYNVYLPDGQIGETGFYKFKHHIFSIRNIKDYVCGAGYWGKYRLDFHGEDSIHFTLIEDSCNARRMDIVGYNPGLRRVITK